MITLNEEQLDALAAFKTNENFLRLVRCAQVMNNMRPLLLDSLDDINSVLPNFKSAYNTLKSFNERGSDAGSRFIAYMNMRESDGLLNTMRDNLSSVYEVQDSFTSRVHGWRFTVDDTDIYAMLRRLTPWLTDDEYAKFINEIPVCASARERSADEAVLECSLQLWRRRIPLYETGENIQKYYQQLPEFEMDTYVINYD